MGRLKKSETAGRWMFGSEPESMIHEGTVVWRRAADNRWFGFLAAKDAQSVWHDVRGGHFNTDDDFLNRHPIEKAMDCLRVLGTNHSAGSYAILRECVGYLRHLPGFTMPAKLEEAVASGAPLDMNHVGPWLESMKKQAHLIPALESR